MRTGVIKKSVMAASLGLASFVSGQAVAADDLILVVCELTLDAENSDFNIAIVHTSEGAVPPQAIAVGLPCLDGVKALRAAGCVRLPFDLMFGGEDVGDVSLRGARNTAPGVVASDVDHYFMAVSCP